MKIYIAKDYKSYPLGLILANSKDVAEAFFFGKYGAFDTVEEIDPSTIEDKMPGQSFFNIISTKEKEFGDYSHSNKVRVVEPR